MQDEAEISARKRLMSQVMALESKLARATLESTVFRDLSLFAYGRDEEQRKVAFFGDDFAKFFQNRHPDNPLALKRYKDSLIAAQKNQGKKNEREKQKAEKERIFQLGIAALKEQTQKR